MGTTLNRRDKVANVISDIRYWLWDKTGYAVKWGNRVDKYVVRLQNRLWKVDNHG